MFATVGDVEIPEAEADTALGVYLSSMPGSINRALGDLEMRHVLPLKRRIIEYREWERVGDMLVLNLEGMESLYEAVRLSRERDGSEVSFGFEGRVLSTRGLQVGDNAVLLYRPRIRRVEVWENEGELEGVPNEVAALIPYFIKGELFREDDPNEAGEARNWYEASVEMLAQNMQERTMDANARVYSVYSQVLL